jgi:hypothetical protein
VTIHPLHVILLDVVNVPTDDRLIIRHRVKHPEVFVEYKVIDSLCMGLHLKLRAGPLSLQVPNVQLLIIRASVQKLIVKVILDFIDPEFVLFEAVHKGQLIIEVLPDKNESVFVAAE